MTYLADAPPYLVRPVDWGSSLHGRYDPANGRAVIVPATKLVVHHTASNVPGPGGEAAFSRQMEAYGESRDGAAIEYSYVIYPSGVLHGGFGDTRGCHAAQDDPATGGSSTYNATSIGVSFVGYFHPPNNDQPTAAAVDTFRRWLAWMLDSGRLTADVLEPAPYGGAPGWYGHRDVWATACPGDVLYPQLAAIIGGAPPSTAPPEDEMTDADWARMQELIHSTVLALIREPETRLIVEEAARAPSTYETLNEQDHANVERLCHGAVLNVVRSEEYAAIIRANTA